MQRDQAIDSRVTIYDQAIAAVQKGEFQESQKNYLQNVVGLLPSSKLFVYT